jgi:hypothetical protein
MDTAVEGVILALPGGTQPSRLVMQLEDMGVITVHLAITPSGKTGYPGSYDDDRFVHVLPPGLACLNTKPIINLRFSYQKERAPVPSSLCTDKQLV